MSDCPLTERQLEAISHLAAGLSVKEIARRWDRSSNTINNYICVSMRIVGAKKSTALVAEAIRRGWIQ